jgi:hypothetical protein
MIDVRKPTRIVDDRDAPSFMMRSPHGSAVVAAERAGIVIGGSFTQGQGLRDRSLKARCAPSGFSRDRAP